MIRYPSGIQEYWDPTTFSEILTENNPTIHIEFEGYEYRVKINQLQTNDTPITILGYNENNETIIQMRNVTELVYESLIIKIRPREPWFLNITKQNKAVEVSLTISIQHVLVISFMVGYPLSPVLLFAIILLYAFRELYKLDRDCGIQIGRKLWDKRQGPLLIGLLIVIGGAILTPFTVGTIFGDFELVEQEETTNRFFSVSINESVDSIQLDLAEGNIYTVTIQSYTPQNISLGFNVHREENIQQLGVANLSGPISWSYEIDHSDESLLALEIQRVDTDVDLEILLEVQRIWLAPRVDIVIPGVLAAIGISLLVIGFVLTSRIHSVLRLNETESEDW